VRLDNAVELKNNLITRNYEAAGHNPAVRVEALTANQIRDSQLSIGLSLKSADNYHLEIRVKKKAGNAYNAAIETKQKAESEVHVGVLGPISVPFRDEAADGGWKYAPFCGPRNARAPLHLGLSISHLDGTAGSLGGFAETVDNQQAIFSNAHVLGSASDIPIYHPGRLDAPMGLCGDDEIATLSNWTTFSTKGSNYLDGAYGLLKEKLSIRHDGNQIPRGFGLPNEGKALTALMAHPDRLAQEGIGVFRNLWHDLHLTKDVEVAKLGRSTGYTTGFVNAFALDDVIIEMDGYGERRFDNLLEIRWKDLKKPFARPGDSGSLIFIPGSCEAVAMHFAGGILDVDGEQLGVSYACSLPHLLSLFKLTFL